MLGLFPKHISFEGSSTDLTLIPIMGNGECSQVSNSQSCSVRHQLARVGALSMGVVRLKYGKPDHEA
jgi:hypothetical protein